MKKSKKDPDNLKFWGELWYMITHPKKLNAKQRRMKKRQNDIINRNYNIDPQPKRFAKRVK